MASSSGTSSGGSSVLKNSGSEEDLSVVMDQRKRKRMISNRESARRSRMRKQKHLDDLASQVAQLRNENHRILTSINITTDRYLTVEAENSVLRAQLGELNHRLESLNEIIEFLNNNANNNNNGDCFGLFDNVDGALLSNNTFIEPPAADSFFFNNPLNMAYMNQPIMASAAPAAADILQY